MVKARKAGVATPCLYLIDGANTKIYMERVDGVTAKHFLLDCMNSEFLSNAYKVLISLTILRACQVSIALFLCCDDTVFCLAV